MAVTRSTPAERRRAAAGAPAPAPRGREAALLAGAFAVVVLGLGLAYGALSRPFADVEARLGRGELLNLNAAPRREALLPLLSFAEEPAERAFLADRLWQRLSRPGEAPVENVGELAKIRVEAALVLGNPRLANLRQRLGERKEGTVALLSLSELRALKPAVVVRTPREFRRLFWGWSILFLLGFAAVHAGFRFTAFRGDELLLPILFTLTGIGLALMVAVRDPLRDLALFRPFVQGVVGGCALLFAASRVDWQRSRLSRLRFAPLGAALLLSILLILFGNGPGGSDAKVNLFGFQPVEAIKILVVLFLAGYFCDRWEFLRELPEKRPALARLAQWVRIPKLEYALPPVAAIAIVLFFFFLQRDLGPALVMALLFLLLYSVARGRPLLTLAGLTLLLGGVFAGYSLGIPQTVTGRIAMWLAPWDTWRRGGDHLAQSLWSFAGGALTGTGLGLGEPQRVPEVHTDLILAAAGEELGFAGLLAIFSLYAVLVQRSFRAARRASGVYSFFLASGLTLVTAIQTLLIAGGVVGFLPLSGVVSPFLSFGRSSMLANFLILGIVLAVSAHPADPLAADGSERIAGTRRFQGGLRWVSVGLAAILAGIVLKVAYVQVLRSDDVLTRGCLALQADGFRRFEYNPRLAAIAATIPRGSIVDRNGVLLATSDPAELERSRGALAGLGAALPAAAAPGERIYPFGGRTFHLLGDLRNRVNWAARNTSFVERDSRVRLQGYDDYAAVVEVPQPGGKSLQLIQLDYHQLIPLLRYRYRPDSPAVRRILEKDRTVRLAVDVRLQLKAGDILERAVRQARLAGQIAQAGAPEVTGGAAVVLDAVSGELLASVGYPWPAHLPVESSADAASGVIDRARYGVYPPGSTFKLVTAMAAMRRDPLSTRRTFECVRLPEGRVGNTVRGWSRPVRDDPTDTVPHGTVDMEKGIVVSCNAYFAQLATYEVEAQPLLETARLLGIAVAKPNTPAQLGKALPQAGYGQGQVTATPFAMARVAAVVGGGGAMPAGRWVLDDSNARTAPPAPIISAEAAAFLARAMRRVVTSGTAARFLKDLQPAIAGKTGTAEVQGKTSHSWFVGFAPAASPTGGGRRIAVAVVVEHGGYGGRLAAPAAGEIVRQAAALGLIR